MRIAVAVLVACAAGCGASGGDYPRTWSLEASPDAVAQVERIGWDAQAFYELVCARARELCADSNLDFHVDAGGGVVRIRGTAPDDGVLGTAADGSGVATVNQPAVFDAILGPAPDFPALAYTTMDEAAGLVAVIVAHEVGHALSLPHNRYSTIMQASPTLLVNALHEFTPDEIERMLRVTGR